MRNIKLLNKRHRSEMCSCDNTDADMGSFNWVLLHLAGPKTNYLYHLEYILNICD